MANLHATSNAALARLAELELEQAMEVLERFARESEVAILAGDFNLAPPVLHDGGAEKPAVAHRASCVV